MLAWRSFWRRVLAFHYLWGNKVVTHEKESETSRDILNVGTNRGISKVLTGCVWHISISYVKQSSFLPLVTWFILCRVIVSLSLWPGSCFTGWITNSVSITMVSLTLTPWVSQNLDLQGHRRLFISTECWRMFWCCWGQISGGGTFSQIHIDCEECIYRIQLVRHCTCCCFVLGLNVFSRFKKLDF